MRNFVSIVLVLFSVHVLSQNDLSKGWEYWRNAEFEDADGAATNSPESDEMYHLRGNVAYVSGKYDFAIQLYSKINPDYDRYQEVLIYMNHIYFFHLKDIKKAKALEENIKNKEAITYSSSLEHCMSSSIVETVAVPMNQSHYLNKYLPMIKGKINGKETDLGFDTGANYLVLPQKMADEFKVQYDTSKYFIGSQGFGSSKMWVGSCEQLVLGDHVILNNVPVTILEEMNTELIIFGTNIIKEFLTTIDYPNQQFIFTSWDDQDYVDRHLENYKGAKMGFNMWGDHYMIGKGKYNEFDVNMFFDSGLVVVGTEGNETIQSWMCMSKETMKSLKIKERKKTSKMTTTQTNDVIEFAGLENENVILSEGHSSTYNFAGIECQILISHGIISKYAWTIDFRSMEYMFK